MRKSEKGIKIITRAEIYAIIAIAAILLVMFSLLYFFDFRFEMTFKNSIITNESLFWNQYGNGTSTSLGFIFNDSLISTSSLQGGGGGGGGQDSTTSLITSTTVSDGCDGGDENVTDNETCSSTTSTTTTINTTSTTITTTTIGIKTICSASWPVPKSDRDCMFRTGCLKTQRCAFVKGGLFGKDRCECQYGTTTTSTATTSVATTSTSTTTSVATTTTVAAFCTNADASAGDLYYQGPVPSYCDDITGRHYDQCLTNSVVEFYCSGTTCVSSIMGCSYVCLIDGSGYCANCDQVAVKQGYTNGLPVEQATPNCDSRAYSWCVASGYSTSQQATIYGCCIWRCL
ncbi:MAG: hypothetical protein ABIG30_00150 [Candidatus Aenigmatarchaeota archaeon]